MPSHELTKAQKRAPNDAKCAWRKMTPQQRLTFAMWARKYEDPR